MLTIIPNAETEALMAMTQLLNRAEWRDSEHGATLRAAITARLNAPEPDLRWLTVAALPRVYAESTDLAAALAARIDAEDNPDVLAKALTTLDQVSPELADPILAAAATERSAGPTITELILDSPDPDVSDLQNVWVCVHVNNTSRGDPPHTTMVVQGWFSDPVAAGPLFRTAVACLRPAFSFNTIDGPARGKAFDLLRVAAAALKPALRAKPNNTPIALAADALIDQVYFASGAFDNTPASPRPTVAQRTRWFTNAMPILEDLTSARHPHSCYQLLETLEFLIAEDPPRVFMAIAKAITEDSDFRFEELGAAVAVRIVERYLADHRQIFHTHPDALAELRRILEVFAAVGWPAALHLSYSLGGDLPVTPQ